MWARCAVATKIDFNKEKKVVQIENYGSEPVRLNEIKVKVKSSARPGNGLAHSPGGYVRQESEP